MKIYTSFDSHRAELKYSTKLTMMKKVDTIRSYNTAECYFHSKPNITGMFQIKKRSMGTSDDFSTIRTIFLQFFVVVLIPR